MREFIMNLLEKINIPTGLIFPFYYSILVIGIIIICIILELFGRWIVLGIFFKITKNSKRPIFSLIKKHRLFQRIIHLVFPMTISIFSSHFDAASSWISHAVTICVIVILISILDSAFSIIDDVYRTHEVSKKRPIKGFLQIMEIVIVIVFLIVIVASWINESPLVLLSGIGAFTAVLTIVFKDTLLGFVAGIQITSDDMIHIGDWIEMPKFSVSGTVTDISLISVRIKNFDNTTTSVPAYSFVSDSFNNWRTIKSAGVRLIKRSTYIDMTSITFCTNEMLSDFSKIEFLNSYIEQKIKEFEKISKIPKYDSTLVKNRYKLTNIGVFRIYLERYLAHLPSVREDMTILVHLLPAESIGLPVEICAFISETDWILFENIQSDIFDHIYAIAPSFGLRLFQEPTGHDMHKLI